MVAVAVTARLVAVAARVVLAGMAGAEARAARGAATAATVAMAAGWAMAVGWATAAAGLATEAAGWATAEVAVGPVGPVVIAATVARGSPPTPRSGIQQMRRPRCPPMRNGSTACWRRTRRMRPASRKEGNAMRGELGPTKGGGPGHARSALRTFCPWL